MSVLSFLSQFTNWTEYSRKSKILLFAYYLRNFRGEAEFSSADIRTCFRDALLRAPSDLSALLRGLSTGRDSLLIASRRRGRYSLSIHGLNEVEKVLASKPRTLARYSIFLAAAVPHLARVIEKVNNDNKRKFLAEAISCLDVEARRATIVMTWLATTDHLYDYVLSKKLADFNSALSRRTDRYSNITVTDKDDFSDISEKVFIEVCRSARIISNDVRKILDEKLGIRNTCAHPSAVEVSDSKVGSFIEDLVENVIVKYEL